MLQYVTLHKLGWIIHTYEHARLVLILAHIYTFFLVLNAIQVRALGEESRIHIASGLCP